MVLAVTVTTGRKALAGFAVDFIKRKNAPSIKVIKRAITMNTVSMDSSWESLLEERGINVTYVGVTHAIVCHVNLSLKCIHSRG